MKQFWLIVVCLAILGYMWREPIAAKFRSTFLSGPKTPSIECTVNGNSCGDLVVMLNALRPGRYYEGAAQLLGVNSEETTNIRRDGGAMVFTLPDGRILIHNQGVTNLEKGYLKIRFTDGHWLKYDEKGIFVEEGN